MIDPTALQTARLSIGQIRHCWPMLADARTTRVTRPSVALSGRAAQARDADLRAERADRDSTTTYRALAASPVPGTRLLEVVDAERAALDTLQAVFWTVASDRCEVPAFDEVLDGLTWLTEHLGEASATTVEQAASQLRAVAKTVAHAADYVLDDDWHGIHRRCPACGQRALSVWDASDVALEHTVECTGQGDDGKACRCAGDDCPCRRPGARAGSRHLWPAHTT